MLVQMYRKIPTSIRERIYDLFLGDLLSFIRSPHNPIWFYIDHKAIKKINQKLSLLKNKSGLEIGGGTYMFTEKGSTPIYPFASRIDGCNFSTTTIWEGKINLDFYTYKGLQLGHQFISEATEIDLVIDKQYDFVISSNCLEHIANPLKAIESWLKSLKPNGYIFLVLPRKQSNFDHRRPNTTFSHMLNDYQSNIRENDMTHFAEIIKLHDHRRDSGVKDTKAFLERAKNNNENRCLHHHVFTKKTLNEIFNHFNLDIIINEESWRDIYILGRKKT